MLGFIHRRVFCSFRRIACDLVQIPAKRPGMYNLLRYLFIAFCLGVVALGAALYVTRPKSVDLSQFSELLGDPGAGEAVFWAGGCASCHAAPEASDEARLVLVGGRAFASDFGTFYAPNITPDAENGIGGWDLNDLANALVHGTSLTGQHYYPAFPYTSYANMAAQDVADLKAYLDTLPAESTPSRPHDVGFPFNIRASLGGWKLLFATDAWALDGDLTEEVVRGRYLVEVLGHCTECHTPRNVLGGLDRQSWMQGGVLHGGERAPNLIATMEDWAAEDIAEYLSSGFTPDFDSVGGEMVEVVENFAHLTDADRLAVGAYLEKLAAVGDEE